MSCFVNFTLVYYKPFTVHNRESDIEVSNVPDVGPIEAEVHGDFGDEENDDDEEDHCSPKLQKLNSVTEEHCKQPMYLLTDSCLDSLLADIPVSR